MSLSPMMQQYHQAKEAAGEALLLFRMGDFYELFYDDAKEAARLLGITLTARDKAASLEKGVEPTPMAGFPHHQLDAYLAKIIRSGRRAAVCEQVEDPKQARASFVAILRGSSAPARSRTTRCSIPPRATIWRAWRLVTMVWQAQLG